MKTLVKGILQTLLLGLAAVSGSLGAEVKNPAARAR